MAGGLSTGFHEGLEFWFRNVSLVESHLQLGSHLAAGTFGNTQVPDKNPMCLALIAFGNIAKDSYRSFAYLAFESKICSKAFPPGQGINLTHHFAAGLPNLKLLK